MKIPFFYKKIEISNLPWIYSPTANIVFAFEKECELCRNRFLPGVSDTPEHRQLHFSEDPTFNFNVRLFLINFVNTLNNVNRNHHNTKTLYNLYYYAIKIASGLT